MQVKTKEIQGISSSLKDHLVGVFACELIFQFSFCLLTFIFFKKECVWGGGGAEREREEKRERERERETECTTL